MQRHQLAGHYGRSIEIDLCAPCHLLWFDSLESVRLTGAALLELVGAMAGAHGTPHHALGHDVRCARCGSGLKRVHNRSRWGATQQLECLRGHGAWQTFALFLSEKGYVRELTSADRAALLQVDAALADALHARGFSIALETNGTLPVPAGLDWICVSPKADAEVVQTSGQELKLVFPQPLADPARFEHMDFERFLLQPMDGPARVENTQAAIAYCLAHPRWRLSVQTHKYLGIP